MIRYIGCIAAVGALLAAEPSPDAAQKEMEAIQGTWAVVTAEQDGKPDDSMKKANIAIQGNQFTTKIEDTAIRHGTITLAPNQTPKAIDLVYSDGFQKGKTSQGIYSLTGDYWIVVFSVPGKDRPTNFDKANGAKHMMLSHVHK